METIVPIKVKILLKPNNYADYPDWTQLPLAGTGTKEEREANVLKHQKLGGWKYDKTSGHQEDNGGDSPYGMQWGLMCVTRQYADEAIAMYPDRVTEMTETELEEFWDNRAHAHIPDNKLDRDELQALKAELDLRTARGASPAVLSEINARIDKALDPLDITPGVRKNRGKKYAEAKTSLNFDVDPSVRKV